MTVKDQGSLWISSAISDLRDGGCSYDKGPRNPPWSIRRAVFSLVPLHGGDIAHREQLAFGSPGSRSDQPL